jgi:hypothetical protein
MKTIILELTDEQLRFLQYVAELEGLTVEQYLLRYAKGQVVNSIDSRRESRSFRRFRSLTG